MEPLTLRFEGEPKAIQSVRFAQIGGFVRKYQPKVNVDWKSYLKLSALNQLPSDWELADGAIELNATFTFTAPKATPKRVIKAIAGGAIVYKPSRPDLCDNLMKGLCDALTGIVWKDDSQICKVASMKILGNQPGIELRISAL